MNKEQKIDYIQNHIRNLGLICSDNLNSKIYHKFVIPYSELPEKELDRIIEKIIITNERRSKIT